MSSSPPPVPEGTTPLPDWLLSFSRSPAHASLVARFKKREGRMTPVEETALLFAVIQRLRPRWSLEIGTFFANTTRIMAEAVAEAGIDGRIFTIDPFGQERVPGILGSWPESLSSVVGFHPWNSMQYFLDLETRSIAKGADSPLGVVFVDGHHTFEYALFDILRSADHLLPGGVIFVDNLEQDGPKSATLQFLRWNPAWTLFYQGKLYDAVTLDPSVITPLRDEDLLWGILLAPDGIQAARQTIKLMKRGIPYLPLRSLTFNLRRVSRPGRLHLKLLYYSVPYDFHLTSRGMSYKQAAGETFISGKDSSATIEFPTPVSLDPAASGVNVCYELELSYRSEDAADAYVVLDAREPVVLQ